jgi:uncharacterized membrane protein
MAESNGIIGYLGLYANADDAMADFEAIKDAHRADWVGTYDAAVFEKTAEGKVKVLNTDATQRGEGAKVGAITGAVFGLIFPPAILASAGIGAAVGAGWGNLTKGFMSGDVKAAADALEPGWAGVMLVADAEFEVGVEQLMRRAAKIAKQRVDASTDEIKAAIDEV